MAPVFIVGPARSGTELVRSVLNRHPLLHIAGETHWFEDMRPRLLRAGGDAAAIHRAAAALAGLRRRSYGLARPSADAGEVAALAAAAASGQGGDAMFGAFCAGAAAAHGKPCWGEKTPRHVFAIDAILAAFPDARIVACVRDPRGAVASYRDWRNRWFDGQALDPALAAAVAADERRARRSYSATICALLWRAAIGRIDAAIAVHGSARVRAIRFEDLVGDPAGETRRLAEWLGIGFDPAMPAVAVRNSSYVAAGTVAGMDGAAAERWRARLSADEVAWIEALTAAPMRRWGYARAGGPPSPMLAARRIAALPLEAARAGFANRARIADLPGYLSARLAGIVGKH